ncbi:xanthine dehydrogenase molybdopterin binding subunit [Acanthopleuribacter pedis]|uniref:Molybdopterin-dependent oxidoreductase n=1 Tax=Acanthopleuribacter pedis TaxID=442870 RepID=A0A8J7QEF6_9BACT|nr:molybdopterin cofactor-binding domain-containing protein [Acanthopleuribacter pedis]MBO1323097.1 molybdopterin-dependent oxidoreductase [Acanthopleuribacter pedis]
MKNIDSRGHVRGESIYVDDMPVREGTLHAAVFGAPYAHGHIKRLDVSAAQRAPGVFTVLTAADIPGENQIGGIIPDEPLLAEDAFHFNGQPIAVVLADSEDQARAALEHIELEYEKLPVITDPREARAKGELLHPPRTFQLGDVDTAWAACSHVFSGRADSGGQEHLYLEAQGAYAHQVENGGVRVYSSTQGPTAVQRTAAKVLGVPMHLVEVDVTRLGGGFGGKEDQATPWAVMAALGALVTGRAVKVVLHRLDDMRMTGKRHPYSSDFKIGLDKDLKIVAYEASFHQDAGAAADLSPAVLERTLFHCTNSYFVPNVKTTAYPCRTNVPPNTAFRGFGGPQGMFVIEAAICHAAEQLGVRPEQIQKANLLSEGDSFPYGQKTVGCLAQRAWGQTEEQYGYAALLGKRDTFNAANRFRKKGIAMQPICFGISFTKTHMNQAAALVHIYSDGSIGVSTGAVEMGQGVNTKMLQVAAGIFSVSADRLKIETTNTTRVANTSPTAASASADLNGKALEKACDCLRDRLLEQAARELGRADTAGLSLKDNAVWADGAATDLSWERLVMSAYLNRISLSQQAHYATPGLHFDTNTEKGEPFAYHVYGTALYEVTLDIIRGTYAFDAVHVVHDFGQSMNPIIDLGQTEGGLVQGMGWMTMEDLLYDKEGRLMSNALSTYKIPDIYAVPKQMDVTFIDTEGAPLAILKSKAVGEPPLMYGMGAYFAIRDAIRAWRDTKAMAFHAPMTPERALLGLYPDFADEPVVDQEVASGAND